MKNDMRPQLRFPGFADAWINTKIGSFASESSIKGHNGAESKKLTVKLHTRGVQRLEERRKGSDNTPYYIRRAGQFIYGKQNFFNGAIGIVPEELDQYESTKDVPAFDVDDKINVQWFYQYMARPEVYEPQKLNCVGSGSKRFHVKKFLSMEIPVPSLEEQTKIADFCFNLDRLIALNKHKLSAMKEYKKSMLQRMFPKAGSSVPELRFPGFSDAWVERKLGDISKTTIGEFVIKTKQRDDAQYPVFNGGISHTGFYDEYNNEGNKILVSARGANAGFVNIIKQRYWAGNSCYSIELLEPKNYNLDFIYAEMKENQWIFTKNQHAANIPSISKKNVEDFVLQFPTLPEQSLIGSFFSNLDRLITLQSQKLSALDLYKKALLQRMFC